MGFLLPTIGPPRRSAAGVRPRRWLPRRTAWFYFLWPARRKVTLCWTPFKGIWPRSISPRDSQWEPGMVEWSQPEWSVKKKTPANAAASQGRHLAPVETELFKSLLGIVEHVAVTKYDDGDPRQPGWVMLRTLGAAWQVEAKDPDSGNKLPVTAAALDDALVLLDALLRSEDAPWEPDAWLQAKKTQKKR